MQWRETQLQWYDGKMLAQEQQLLDFIHHHDIGDIRYMGDCDHLRKLLDLCKGPAQLLIYMINHESDINDICKVSNAQLGAMASGSFLYLSLNKFLLIPRSNAYADDDYDAAILTHVRQNIRYHLLGYQSGVLDGGKRFNWVHPLTRFYFTNANTT